MSGNRFKSRVEKVFRRHLPAHLSSNFIIVYYVEWRADRNIQFVMWSKEGVIPYPALKALAEMFNSGDLYVINYHNRTQRIPEQMNYRGEFTYFSPINGSSSSMKESELFVIQIRNADFTKIFTFKDEEDISIEAKRFELEE